MKNVSLRYVCLAIALSVSACEQQEPSSPGESDFVESTSEALFSIDDASFALEEEVGEAPADREEALSGLCQKIGQGDKPPKPAGERPQRGRPEGEMPEGEGPDGEPRDGDQRPPRGEGSPDGEAPEANGEFDGRKMAKARKGKKGGKGKKGHLHKQRMKLIKMAYDVDGDGELSEDEKLLLKDDLTEGCEAKVARILEAYDIDGDGALSEEEKDVAAAAKEEKKAERKENRDAHRAALLDQYDADEDGELNEEERAAAKDAHKEAAQARIDGFIETFDTDEDGELSDDEFAVFTDFVRERVQNAEPIIPKPED